jgi:hypothetical protein
MDLKNINIYLDHDAKLYDGTKNTWDEFSAEELVNDQIKLNKIFNNVKILCWGQNWGYNLCYCVLTVDNKSFFFFIFYYLKNFERKLFKIEPYQEENTMYKRFEINDNLDETKKIVLRAVHLLI